MTVVRAIVLGHGDFASGILSAVSQITGCGDEFLALSNAGLGAPEIELLLDEAMSSTGALVVFTDLPAGSSTIAARRLQRRRPSMVLVTGANLAALLDFLFHADMPPSEAAQHAVDKGRASVAIVGSPGAD